MASAIDFHAIFDAGPAAYLLLCADPPRYTIADVSRAYLGATGTDRDALVGRGLFEVFPENPDEHAENGASDLRTSLDRVLRDGVPDVMGIQKYDIPLRDGSGQFEVRYWSPINTPIVDDAGEVRHVLHRVEDITDFILAREGLGTTIAGRSGGVRARDSIEAEVRRSGAQLKEANRQLKAMSEQLVEANARLEGLDRLKTEFFANVSHEFRTPLTLMLGPLEDLSARQLGEVERQLVESAQRNALRLQKLVNTLLDFSRLEAGRLKVNFQPTDLPALTAELASHFDSACAEAKVRLVVDCPPLDAPVPVDPEMWENIVLNLISNAFKFTFEGEIEVALRASADKAELTVRDSGVGIAEEELPLIFERFHRVQSQRGRSHEGSGIGLSLVRDLVRLHGGDISVESNVGQGTRFVVTLPLHRSEAVEAAKVSGEVSGAVEGTVESQSPEPAPVEPPKEQPGAAYVRAVISGALSPRPTTAQELFARTGTGWVPPESEYRLADKTA